MLDDENNHLLNELFIRVIRSMHQNESSTETAFAQNRLLSIVSRENGISQKSLADRVGVRPQSLCETIKKLEIKGLIYRTQPKKNLKEKFIFITEAGKSEADNIALERKNSRNDFFAVLTEDEKETLNAILKKLVR